MKYLYHGTLLDTMLAKRQQASLEVTPDIVLSVRVFFACPRPYRHGRILQKMYRERLKKIFFIEHFPTSLEVASP